MKTVRKYLTLLCAVSFIISISLLVGCADNDGDKITGKYDYMISGFETDHEMQSFLWKSMFGRVSIVTDSEFVKSGNASAKMEIYGMDDENQKPYFSMFTDTQYLGRVDYREATSFELQVYSACEAEYKIYMQFRSGSEIPEKSGFSKLKEITLLPNQWNTVRYEVDRVDMNKNWGIDKVAEFKFIFDNPLDYIPVVYFDDFKAKMDADPLPTFAFEQSRELVKPGTTYTIPVMAGSTRSITTYNAKTKLWEEVDFTPDTEYTEEDKLLQQNMTTFEPQRMNYRINYTKELQGYRCTVKTIELIVENGELVTMSARDCVEELDRPNTGFAGLSDDNVIKFLSDSTLKMKGARFPEAPYGFTWNTGYTGGLKSIVVYIYNMRNIETQLQTVGNVLMPRQWTRVEYSENEANGTLTTQAANWKNNSVIKRNSDTGEWSIFFSTLIWDEQYEMYFNALLEKSDTDTRVLELKKDSDFVAEGNVYQLETFTNATWTVSRNGIDLPNLKNAAAIPGTKGEYKVVYTKDFGNNMSGSATFTLHCDKYDSSNATTYDALDISDDGHVGTYMPEFKIDKSLSLVGGTSFNVSMTDGGMNLKQNIGFLWNSRIKGEIESVIIYIYNKGNVNYGLQTGDHTSTRCLPKTWTRVEISGDFEAMAAKWTDVQPTAWDSNDGSSQVTKSSEGEWMFQLCLWKWEENYDFNFNIIVNQK